MGVSYIITVYNKAKYLPEVIESLKNQKGDFEKEYIFVDDGSTDNSLEIISDLTKNMQNVHIIEQQSLGLSNAANSGLSLASYNYIKFLNADDILIPEATEILLDAIRKTGAGVAYGISLEQGMEDKALESTDDYKIRIIKNPLNKLFYPLYGVKAANCLIKRDLIEEAGLCDTRIFIYDFPLLLKLAVSTKFCKVRLIIAKNISHPEDKLSKEQISYDKNLSIYLFLRENKKLLSEYKYAALKKCTARSFNWVKKNNFFSIDFLKVLIMFIFARLTRGHITDQTALRWMRRSTSVISNRKIRKLYDLNPN